MAGLVGLAGLVEECGNWVGGMGCGVMVELGGRAINLTALYDTE